MALVEDLSPRREYAKILRSEACNLYYADPDREKNLREFISDLEKYSKHYLQLASVVQLTLLRLYSMVEDIGDNGLDKALDIVSRIEELRLIHQKEYEAFTTLVNLLRREAEIFRDLKTMCR